MFYSISGLYMNEQEEHKGEKEEIWEGREAKTVEYLYRLIIHTIGNYTVNFTEGA